MTKMAEVAELRRMIAELQERINSSQSVPTTVTKDLTIANLIENWRGDGSGIPVHAFFKKIDDAASIGNWSDSDKVRIVSLKLRGPAALYYNSCPQLQKPDLKYETLTQQFIERFKLKQLDQYHYTALQSAQQRRDETPEAFADRCRILCAKTVRQVTNPVEQKVIDEEAERRLLAAYINGLQGVVGQQVRYRLPNTMQEAVQIATTVASAERQYRQTLPWKPIKKDTGEGGNVFATNVTCYNCNKVGHIAKNCFLKKNNNKYERSNGDKNKKYDKTSDKSKLPLSEVKCFKCQGKGHYARNCTKLSSVNPNANSSTCRGTAESNWDM